MIAYFYILVMVFNCFAETTDQLSKKQKQIVRDNLHSLLLPSRQPIENEDEQEDSQKRREKILKITTQKWEMVLDKKHSSYVKTLFLQDKRLFKQTEKIKEAFFLSIYFGNSEMVRFFAEQRDFINIRKSTTGFTPWMLAFMNRQEDIILYLLNHPQTDLRKSNVWGDNIFHMIFLISGEKRINKRKLDRLDILNIIFQPKHFSKVFDLLLVKNGNGETPLDLALRENSGRFMKNIDEQVVRLFESRTAMVKALKGLSREQVSKIFDFFLTKNGNGETLLDQLDRERNSDIQKETLLALKRRMTIEFRLFPERIDKILYHFSKYPVLPLEKKEEKEEKEEKEDLKNTCKDTFLKIQEAV